MKKGFKFNPFTAMFDLVNKFSVKADGYPPVTDPLTLFSGTGVNLVQVGNSITINATGLPPILTGFFDQEEYTGLAGQVVFPLVAIPLDASQVFVSVRGQFLPNDPAFYTYNNITNEISIVGGVTVGAKVSILICHGVNGVLFTMENAVGGNPYTLVGTPVDPSVVMAIVDGGFVPKSDYAYDSIANEVEFNLGSEPAPAQNVSFFYQSGGTALRLTREVLIGAVDGVNDTFGQTVFGANEPESSMLLRDGRKVPDNQFTRVGKSFVFNAGHEPAIGQKIEAIYFYVSVNSEQTQYFTLNAGQVAAKQLQLDFTPKNPTEVLLDGGSSGYGVYGEDFIVEGSTVKWAGLNFDGDLTVGSKIRLHYHI